MIIRVTLKPGGGVTYYRTDDEWDIKLVRKVLVRFDDIDGIAARAISNLGIHTLNTFEYHGMGYEICITTCYIEDLE